MRFYSYYVITNIFHKHLLKKTYFQYLLENIHRKHLSQTFNKNI